MAPLLSHLIRNTVVNVEEVPEENSSLSVWTGQFPVHLDDLAELHHLPGDGLVGLLSTESCPRSLLK